MKPQGGRKWLVAVIVLFVAAYIGWTVFATIVAIVNRKRTEHSVSICAVNMMVLLNAQDAYSANHGGRLPLAHDWCDQLLPYVISMGGDRSTFVCPEARNQTCSYALNRTIAGMRPTDIRDAQDVVMLFESDSGWNATGGPALLCSSPRHRVWDFVGFADGGRKIGRRKEGSRGQWLREYTRPRIRWSP
jgi:hypothetical protein